MKARFLALFLGVLGLTTAANAAVTITAVGDGDGYDELNVEAFRSTSVPKGLDADGNDEYGTEGTFFFGTGATAGNGQGWAVHTQTGANWAIFAAGANFASVSEQAGYGPFDNPTLSGETVADWTICGIGTATAAAGAWAEVLTFTIDSNAPTEFRVGIMSGTQGTGDGRWDPTGLRMSVDGGAATTITNLVNNGNNDPEWVFFDVDLGGATNGTFSIEGQSRNAGGNTKGTALSGATFDVPFETRMLSSPTVTNITSATALGGVELNGTNAHVTLFWGESDEGEAFTWGATNALTSEQVVGPIDNVAISNLTADTRYFYIFYASNALSGMTGWSDLNQSFGSALTGKSVTNLTASAVNALQVDLSWTDDFNTDTGYVVQRSPDGAAWATLATSAADASGYADTSVSASSNYHYRVAATNGAGLSDWSDPAEATTPEGTTSPDAPDHWWKLDEPSGTLVRDFGLTGGMDGTILGTTSTRVTPANSRVGNALDVSAGLSYVDAGNVPISGSFTASIWVDPINVNRDWTGYICKWWGPADEATGYRKFWVGNKNTDGGHIRYGISSDGSNEMVLDIATVYGNNCWQMITVLWDEATKYQKIYVNGALKGSIERVGVSLATPQAAPLRIGALGQDAARTFYGTVDDARLYARALSDEEIRALYANPGVQVPELMIAARDDFDGPELETGWTLDDREIADSHDLAARLGWLRVASQANANTWLNARDGAQMLYTDTPDGSFTMETCVDIATGNGGTLVDKSSGGLVVHDPSYSTAQYPFALYFWLGHSGGNTTLNLQKPGGNLATAITGVSAHMYLRLYRNADDGTWTASYKVNEGDDWTEWTTIADGELPNTDVSDDDIYVGIMSKTWGANPANIDYDYFGIPEAVERVGTLLILQ
jgi:hypothetical protein